MVRRIKLLVWAALTTICLGWPGGAGAENRILIIRHWVAPDHTRVVIDTSEEAVYRVEKEERRISIQLDNTAFPTHLPGESALKKPGLERIKLLARGEKGVRVELALPAQVQTTVFTLKPFQDKPYRIVIDIVLPEVAKKESEAREQVKLARKNRIIVIDPGHGGEAVGAIGKEGTMEKDVVLAIARKLRDFLNARPGYRAFLTRDGDYYVAFSKRLMIAREYGADLFVSIHADAARNRSASGSSVYCLSTGGASSAAAKILARSENLADLVGGVSNGEGSDASDPIILNMFQTNAINQSKIFGNAVLKNISQVSHLKFPNVQEAPFIVLKLPEVPSVLIETAYISNPAEEKLLRSDKFQARLAESVMLSVAKFLPPLPAVPVVTAGGQGGEAKPAEGPGAGGGQGETPPKPATAAGDAGESTRGQTLEAVLAAGTSSRASSPEAAGRPDDPLSRGASAGPAKTGKAEGEKAAASADQAAVGQAAAAEIPPPASGRTAAVEKVKPSAANPPVPAPAVAVTGKAGSDNGSAAAGPQTTKPGQAAVSPAAGASARTKAAKPTGAPPAEKTFLWQVRYGESLARIARRYGTTVEALVALNHLKPKAPLFVGRQLKVPGEPPSEAVAVAPPARGASAGSLQAGKTGPDKAPTSAAQTGGKHAAAKETPPTAAAGKGKAGAGNEEGAAPASVSQSAKPAVAAAPPDAAVPAKIKTAKPDGESPAEKTFLWRVRYGESLARIARRYGTTVETLVALNHLKPKEPLFVGRPLKVPGEPPPEGAVKGGGTEKTGENGRKAKTSVPPVKKQIHQVKKGDTLETIAKRYGTTVEAIVALNKLKRSSPLTLDRKLLVPGGAAL